MKLADIADDREVVITAGPDGHPLRGHRATVVMVKKPLPFPPPVTFQQIADTYAEDSSAVALRSEDWEEPFCWPDGKVLLFLGDRPARKWAWPYIWVDPAHIRPAR